MKSTFSVLFFVKKDKQKINGSYPIFVRITIDGVASRFNSKLDVQPKLWDGKAGKAAGRSAEATRINRLLDDINASLNTIYHELQRRDNYVTAEKVKNEFLGHSENHDTILNLFQKHNDDVKQLVGISKTIATYRKYEVTRRHLADTTVPVISGGKNTRIFLTSKPITTATIPPTISAPMIAAIPYDSAIACILGT